MAQLTFKATIDYSTRYYVCWFISSFLEARVGLLCRICDKSLAGEPADNSLAGCVKHINQSIRVFLQSTNKFVLIIDVA